MNSPGQHAGSLIPRIGGSAPARHVTATRVAELVALVRARLDLAPEEAVTVQQLRCSEPGCPPLETVIAVLGAAPRRWTVHRPLAELHPVHLMFLLDTRPQGEHR